MAQVNFLWDDDGTIVSGINGNGTSAITAGDILYASAPTTSPFGTTVPTGTIAAEIEVEPIKFATATLKTQGGRLVGVAMHDAAAGSYVSFATRGIFLSPIIDTTGTVAAGIELRAAEGQTTSGVTNSGTTVGPTAAEQHLTIGRALTGAATDGHYIVWLLNIR